MPPGRVQATDKETGGGILWVLGVKHEGGGGWIGWALCGAWDPGRAGPP
jgi:hypothetical protein